MDNLSEVKTNQWFKDGLLEDKKSQFHQWEWFISLSSFSYLKLNKTIDLYVDLNNNRVMFLTKQIF